MDRARRTAGLNEALDRLWKQFLPQIEERVAALESAAQALAKAKCRTSSGMRRKRQRTSWPASWAPSG